MTRPAALLRRTRRALLARRRLLAALCAGLAVAAALQAVAAPPQPRATVLVAAHDLAAGARLGADDLATRGFASGTAPAGTLTATQALGRTTVGPVRAGEPLTDVRVLGRPLLDALGDAVAAPVRIADPAAVSLLEVGDRIDVLAADPQGGGARVVVSDAPVLALPGRGASGTDLVSGALVVVAVPPEVARDLAAAGVDSVLSLTLGH